MTVLVDYHFSAQRPASRAIEEKKPDRSGLNVQIERHANADCGFIDSRNA